MTYSVKEMFYSLQGEGFHSGRPSVFVRFSGCNLWSGLERDRDAAQCRFCDTDFLGTDGEGGGKFQTAEELAAAARSFWPKDEMDEAYVVCTGGEPLLQLDEAAVSAFHKEGFEVAVESNGTLLVPAGVDWICVSPKSGSELCQIVGNELKLVYPQEGMRPSEFESMKFDYFFLQPKDDAALAQNTKAALAYCLENPVWRLSLQTHKAIGIR